MNSSILDVIRTAAGSTKMTTERLLGVQKVNSAANGPKYLRPERKQAALMHQPAEF